VAVKVFDRHPDRAKAFVASARGQPGVASAGAVATARDAAGEATVVIAAGGISKAQEMTPDWLTPGTLVVAVDFATYVSAEIAKAAHSFAVDDRAQFLAYRDAGYFDGFPDPSETLGEALDRGTDRPRGGPVVVAHLGVGTADILFANEVLRTAQERGIGTSLSR
jgi:ornithine cyclodeaminase/alanine dehydrogenase-like protein (mu-crystallin family)